MTNSETPEATRAFIIAVTGGSGAGKSCLARALIERLPPGAAVLISEDDYYRRIDDPGFDPRQFDFDVPAARDHAQLAEHLARLRRGEPIDRPVYSFRIHAPLKRRQRVAPTEVVIVEGLHVLHDPAVRAMVDLSLFVDIDDDIRFIRRLLRDTRERGRSVRSVTDQYLATVKPAHVRFVQPARALADLILTIRPGTDANDAQVLQDWLDEVICALPERLKARVR